MEKTTLVRPVTAMLNVFRMWVSIIRSMAPSWTVGVRYVRGERSSIALQGVVHKLDFASSQRLTLLE